MSGKNKLRPTGDTQMNQNGQKTGNRAANEPQVREHRGKQEAGSWLVDTTNTAQADRGNHRDVGVHSKNPDFGPSEMKENCIFM